MYIEIQDGFSIFNPILNWTYKVINLIFGIRNLHENSSTPNLWRTPVTSYFKKKKKIPASARSRMENTATLINDK